MNIAAVLLAAGLSSRMGDFKPLIRLGEKSLLGHCQALFHRCDLVEILVVAGHRAGETALEAATLNLRCIENSGYRAGMFSSIRCAVAALGEDIDGFFVLPVDIPLIRPATIHTLLTAFSGQEDAVIYPTFIGRRGHPPLIPAALIPAILAHDGTGGLETLLSRYRGTEVAVWDEGILMDADTPEDLERLRERHARISLPTRQEASILAELKLPEKTLAHGRQVEKVAVILAEALNNRGYRLDMDLIHAAALLHDLAKGQPNHATRGAEMLAEWGLPEVAAVTTAHMDLAPPSSGRLTEKELVCLADKVISGTRRVRIEERYSEKLRFHAGDAAIWQEIIGRRDRALALQEMLEQQIGRDLETLLDEAGL